MIAKIEQHISSLPNTEKASHFGYTFFFYDADHTLPFVSIADSDNEYDQVSDLSREGVYRVNIGVSKDTYTALFPDSKQEWDFTALNKFMPHPHYAAQYYICILSPAEETLPEVFKLIGEAHSVARARFDRKRLKG
jgi:hypothetical protein